MFDGKVALTKDGKVVNYKLTLQLPPGVKLVRGILIGGATAFDDNDAALAAIMAEWTSPRSFTQRRNNLLAGINDPALGLIRLKVGTTVLSNTVAAHDQFYGSRILDDVDAMPDAVGSCEADRLDNE